jgi:hypothetical protein
MFVSVFRGVASASTVAASDVPNVYDVVIDGNGYIFDRRLPERAVFAHTKTFIDRLSLTGDYGDSQQDFFLTTAQNDWTGGELQKFGHATDATANGFWQGSAIDVSTVPGQVTLRQAVKSLTFAASVRAVCARGQASSQNVIAASTTNLYEVDPAGAITDRAAHGLGAAPARFGAATDGANIYVSRRRPAPWGCGSGRAPIRRGQRRPRMRSST